MKKFVLFMIFATAIICSLAIVSASAATEGTPIATVEDFEKIGVSELADGAELPKYYLANDIDFGGKEYDTFIVEKFSGTLDGNGHTIFNFKITGTQNSDYAIFKQLMEFGNTVIKDLKIGKADNMITLQPSDLASGKSHAVIAGSIANKADFTTTFSGVDIYANINFPYSNKCNVGGFVGYARYVVFENCKMNGTIKVGSPDINNTVYMNAGGFIGAHKAVLGTLKGCENYADITVYGSTTEARAAGIVGYTDGDLVLENCINRGNISALDFDDEKWGYAQSDSMCAGILGHLNKKVATLTGCINYGTLLATNRIGTMVAKITGVDAATEILTIKDCKNEGKLTSNVVNFNDSWGESDCPVKVEGYTNLSTEKVEYTTIQRGETTPYEEPDETTTEPKETEPVETPDATTTEAPTDTDKVAETTTAAPTDKVEEKGCGGFVSAAAVIAVLVSALGCAIVIKKN